MSIIKIVTYINSSKDSFTDWLDELDTTTRSIILQRIARVRLGNFGDCKPIQGVKGMLELRIDYGPGYRVYLGRVGINIFVLLIGGDKGSQSRDILKAKKYWLAYTNKDKT